MWSQAGAPFHPINTGCGLGIVLLPPLSTTFSSLSAYQQRGTSLFLGPPAFVPSRTELGRERGSPGHRARTRVLCSAGRRDFEIPLRVSSSIAFQKTGARIKIFSNCAPQSTDRIIQIVGQPQKCIQSIREIIALIKTVRPRTVRMFALTNCLCFRRVPSRGR